MVYPEHTFVFIVGFFNSLRAFEIPLILTVNTDHYNTPTCFTSYVSTLCWEENVFLHVSCPQTLPNFALAENNMHLHVHAFWLKSCLFHSCDPTDRLLSRFLPTDLPDRF
jgi:hypothetical protein